MPQTYRNQLKSLYLISFSVGFVLWYGIEKIFLQDVIGVGPTSIGIIVAVYMAITLIFDVPAGVLADRWGKKRTLMVAIGTFILADVTLGASTNFAAYVIGTALWGFFTVLYYGTYEALLYNTTKHLGLGDDYEKINASQQAWFMFGIGISSLLSGFFATFFSLQAVYFVSIIPLVVALFVAFGLREPPIHADDDTVEEEILNHWQHLLQSFKEILRSPNLRLIAVGMLIVLAIMTPIYEFSQYIYIHLFDGDEVSVGIANGVAGLLLVVGFLIATRVRLAVPRLIAIVLLLLLATVWLQNYTALLVFMMIFVLMPIVENRIQTQIQHSLSNKKRATMTSAIKFMGNVFVVPFVIVFSVIAEHRSIWLAYSLQILVVASLLVYYVLRTHKLKKYEIEHT